jgi:hypothetical protein
VASTITRGSLAVIAFTLFAEANGAGGTLGDLVEE